nr:TetR/AcrR family transcriptional regulator [Streptomyces sp. YIM 132580]
MTRIAKETGLSGPALHRYFTSRDDLLNSLIRDGYDDAAAGMARAADRSAKGSRGVRGRPHDLAAAHRAWAVAEPHRDLLVQGAPVPGHVAPADTWERARVVLGPFLPLFATGSPGPAVASTADGMTAWLAADSTVGSHGCPGTRRRRRALRTGRSGRPRRWRARCRPVPSRTAR